MVDGTDKHSGMDGRRAAGKKGKKDDLDNLKKEVEMVRSHLQSDGSLVRSLATPRSPCIGVYKTHLPHARTNL